MKKYFFLMAVAAALPGSLLASEFVLAPGQPGIGADEVSFNGAKDSITLGSGDCPSLCLMFGSVVGDPLDTSWFLTQPDLSASPFVYTYDGSTGTITVNGSPTLAFGLVSIYGNEADGSFRLTGLQNDGNNGVDILGTFTLATFTEGPASPDVFFSDFEAQFGPPGTTYSFALDIGDCTAGSKTDVTCVPPTPGDPTGTLLSGSFITDATVPEPAAFGLIGAGLSGVGLLRRFKERAA